jgi:hypothetical protein
MKDTRGYFVLFSFTYSFFGLNFVLSILFSNILSHCSSLTVIYHVSHLYKLKVTFIIIIIIAIIKPILIGTFHIPRLNSRKRIITISESISEIAPVYLCSVFSFSFCSPERHESCFMNNNFCRYYLTIHINMRT